jgi:invasion protein IalB
MMDRLGKWLDWRGILVAASVVLLPATAGAQTTTPPTGNVEDLQRWTKVCNPDPVTNEQGCAIVYRLYANPTTIMMQVSLSYLLSDPNEIVISIWLPVGAGMFVDQGVQMQVDEREPFIVPFRLCDGQICIAENQVDLAVINAFKAGGQLFVRAIVPHATEGAQRVELPVTLAGFTATYDGPGLTPEQAQAEQEALNQALLERAEAVRQTLLEAQQQLQNNPPAPAPAP